MVFTGSLDWRPNVDAILYFLDGIWPLIRASHPEASFTIVGRRPTDVLKDKAGGMPGIMLTGTVDDVRPYIEEAQVYVVPLRVGGGSRLKILEALSMKKAVVSTSVGAEGLDVCAGENILTADTPADFAAAVSRLYRESALRERLGTSGRRLVESRYEWQKPVQNPRAALVCGRCRARWYKKLKLPFLHKRDVSCDLLKTDLLPGAVRRG